MCFETSFQFVLGIVLFSVFFNNCISICYTALCVCFRNWPIKKSVKTFFLFVFSGL